MVTLHNTAIVVRSPFLLLRVRSPIHFRDSSARYRSCPFTVTVSRTGMFAEPFVQTDPQNTTDEGIRHLARYCTP